MYIYMYIYLYIYESLYICVWMYIYIYMYIITVVIVCGEPSGYIICLVIVKIKIPDSNETGGCE